MQQLCAMGLIMLASMGSAYAMQRPAAAPA